MAQDAAGAVTSARGRLLEAASRLFYARGISATGIDTITAEAGVAKQSLYNNFRSKDELTLAYLTARHEEWLQLYRARLAQAYSPRARVLAVFDAYLDHATHAYEHGFRGCGLLNAAAELPVGSAGREAVRRHKEQVQSLLAGHLAERGTGDAGHQAGHQAGGEVGEGSGGEAGPEAADVFHAADPGPDDEALAEHLAFLLEGAMSRAGLEGRPDRLLRARRIASSLLDAR